MARIEVLLALKLALRSSITPAMADSDEMQMMKAAAAAERLCLRMGKWSPARCSVQVALRRQRPVLLPDRWEW